MSRWLRFLFVPALFLAPLAQAGEAWRVRCQNLFHDIDSPQAERLLESWNRLVSISPKERPGAYGHRLDAVVENAIALLNHEGVKWSYSEKSKRILVIEGQEAGPWLNRIAAGMGKNLKGLRLEFDPRSVHDAEAIFYDEGRRRIVIDRSILSAKELSPNLFHEIRHALNQIRYYEGMFNDFSGYVFTTSTKIDLHQLYQKGFSLDEMNTYGTEVYQWARRWKKWGRDFQGEDYRDLVEVAKIGRQLTRWTHRITSKSFALVSEALEKGWRMTEDIQTDGVRDVRVWTFVHPQAKDKRIEIAQNHAKNLQDEHQEEVLITLTHGKFETVLNYAAPLSRSTPAAWLHYAQQKLQYMSDQTKRALPHWESLVSSVQRNDVGRVEEAAFQIKNLVQQQSK